MSTETLAIIGGTPVIPRGSHEGWPIIRGEDHRALGRVLDRGVLCGATAPEVTGLQKEWNWFCGSKYCLATNSGTSALHCAVAAAGVNAGDEVIVPALSFIATAYAVAHQQATPIFCDVDPVTFNIDPQQIERLITPRTKAILVVHLHGLPADMDAINEIARRHGVSVIEDAAQAHGATYRGHRVGTLGDTAAFSLNATKMLVGGEGGLFVTNNESAFKVAKRLALFGEDGELRGSGHAPTYLSHGVGFNYRCSEFSAAMARSQLRHLEDSLNKAQENAGRLLSLLNEVPGLQMPVVGSNYTSTWHKFRVRINPEALGYGGSVTRLRDLLVRALIAEGVAASLWQMHPLPANPAFRRHVLGPWNADVNDEELLAWNAELFPEASRTLDETFIFGSERTPLCAQPLQLMDQYATAVSKVMGSIDQLLSMPENRSA